MALIIPPPRHSVVALGDGRIVEADGKAVMDVISASGTIQFIPPAMLIFQLMPME